MEQSINPSKLAEALAKAQSEIKPPKRNCEVDFEYQGRRTKYKYADLGAILTAITPPLSKNGLALTHRMILEGQNAILITELRHISGEILNTFYPLPNPSSLKPQAFGSSYTYARRYSVCGLVGISAEDDDDGQQAEPPEKTPVKQTRVVNADPADPNFEPKEFREARERREAVQKEAANLHQYAPPNYAPQISQSEFNGMKNSRGTVGVSKIVEKMEEKRETPAPAVSQPNELDSYLAENKNPDVESYRCNFGRFSGKSLKEIGLSRAKDYADWIIQESKKRGEILQPSAQKFCDMVDLAMSGLP